MIGDTFLVEPNRTADTSELDLSVDSTQIRDDDIKNLEACARLEYAAVTQGRDAEAVLGAIEANLTRR